MLINFKQFITENTQTTDQFPDISHFKKKEDRLGSNPGGVYVSPTDNSKHYVKTYANDQQARTEVAAAHVYHKIGVPTLNPSLAKTGGKTAVMTSWRDDLQDVKPWKTPYAALPDHDQQQLANHFVAAVVTKNWDAVGLEHDNIMRAPSGELHSVDLGGSMRFRAMGKPKPFGADVDEYRSLRAPHLPAGQAFQNITDRHIQNAIDNAQLDHKDLTAHFTKIGLQDPEQHAQTIMDRFEALKKAHQPT